MINHFKYLFLILSVLLIKNALSQDIYGHDPLENLEMNFEVKNPIDASKCVYEYYRICSTDILGSLTNTQYNTRSQFRAGKYFLEQFIKDVNDMGNHTKMVLRYDNLNKLKMSFKVLKQSPYIWIVVMGNIAKSPRYLNGVVLDPELFLDAVASLPREIMICVGFTVDATAKDAKKPYSLEALLIMQKFATDKRLAGRNKCLAVDPVHFSQTRHFHNYWKGFYSILIWDFPVVKPIFKYLDARSFRALVERGLKDDITFYLSVSKQLYNIIYPFYKV